MRTACTIACVLAVALGACSEVTHTVGLSDVNAVSGASGTSSNPPNEAGSGGSTPTDDGSTGLPDAAIPDAAPQCADNVVPAIRKRLNLYLLIDTNFLVADSGSWEKVRQGILQYARSEEAAGTGLGLRLIDPPLTTLPFPLPDTEACDPAWYSRRSTGAVAQEPLPLNVDALTSTLGSINSTWTTPLDPALQGALDLTFSLKNTRPEEDQAVVLISDAFLDLSCASTAEQLINTAARGRTDYGIRSYMIELLNPVSLIPPVLSNGTLIPLDPVASAGGTTYARSFDLASDSASDLADRLHGIQRDAEVCEYAVPLDSSWMEVLLAVDTGVGPGPLARLTDASECGASGGWYVSYNDFTSGTTWVRACPTSCAAIATSALPPVWIVDCDLSQP